MSGREPGARTEFTPSAVNLNLFWGQGWSPGVQFAARRGAGVNHLPAVQLLPLQDVFCVQNIKLYFISSPLAHQPTRLYTPLGFDVAALTV